MIFRLIALCVLGTAALTAATAEKFDFQAEVTEADAEGRIVGRGHAQFRDRDLLLTADELRANRRTGEITAVGNVILTRATLRLLADRLEFRQKDSSFDAQNVRLGSFPYYAQGTSASGTTQEITIKQATVSYGEPGPWQPTLTAASVTYAPNRQLRSEGAFVGIGQGRFLPFPRLHQDLAAPAIPYVTLTGGFRSSLGAFLEAGLHTPVAPGVRLGADVGIYTSRGFMAGPSGSYVSAKSDLGYRGYFRTGYINDHGDKQNDVLGRPVPEDRGYVEWQHQQQLTERLTLNAQVNWWRDSEVLRDFRSRAFFPVQEPDTFVEAVYTGQNYFLSAFGRFQPNSFQRVQERFPEIRFDLLPTAMGNGFYERFSASAAILREDPLPVSPLTTAPRIGLRSDRLDAYYALSRPIAHSDWFVFTPMAGGRVTHYANSTGAVRTGNYTRVLGELGFDATLQTSATFPYRNERWKINGLRHLLTPRLSYRYAPEADHGISRIPRIDRNAFSTYLQPLGLAVPRNLDDLRALNALRLGFDNTLQTRDETYGSRDLVVLNVANDFRFKRQRTERDVSEVHTEFGLMPARWLQLDIYNSVAPQNLKIREFNTGLTLRDGDQWSVRFSSNFLRRELEDYAVDGRVRINEAYEFLTRLHYDARKRRFNEQAYGITQNLSNTWLISYVVTLYSGPRRESSFGLRVQIDTVRF